jgi:hypothetical protein
MDNWSNFNFFLPPEGAGAWLCITTDYETNRNALNSLDRKKIIDIVEVLETEGKVLKIIHEVGLDYDQVPSFEQESRFDALLKELSYDEFETLVTRFLDRLKGNKSGLGKYYRFLSQYEDTFVNTKYVKGGGPGLPDFLSFNLKNYIESGLAPDRIGECKMYLKSRIKIEDYNEAVSMAQHHGGEFLMVASTNDVAPSVWHNIHEARKGVRYPQVLFDKDTLLLLSNVSGEDLTLQAD